MPQKRARSRPNAAVTRTERDARGVTRDPRAVRLDTARKSPRRPKVGGVTRTERDQRGRTRAPAARREAYEKLRQRGVFSRDEMKSVRDAVVAGAVAGAAGGPVGVLAGAAGRAKIGNISETAITETPRARRTPAAGTGRGSRPKTTRRSRY